MILDDVIVEILAEKGYVLASRRFGDLPDELKAWMQHGHENDLLDATKVAIKPKELHGLTDKDARAAAREILGFEEANA